MKTKLFAVLTIAAVSALLAQGPLTPPGAPAPTMKTLDQIEPRTPVSSPNFFITASGSYYLTKDIAGLAGLHGITIQADNVTLDLNGFALIGTGGGGTHGIFVSAGGKNLTVRNGTVRNWGGRGVRAGSATNSRFEHLRVSNNVAEGIEAGTTCAITGCSVDSCGARGILAGANALISDCTVTASAGGISVGDNSRVKDCVTDASTGLNSGIDCGENCAVTGCAARNNGAFGINGGIRGAVQSCVAQGNGQTGIAVGLSALGVGSVKDSVAHHNGGSGINVGPYCVVAGCAAFSNTLDGILVGNGGRGTLVDRCSATLNSHRGIVADIAGMIVNCITSQNVGDGIMVVTSCVVKANHCYENGFTADGAGIHAISTSNHIESNTVIDNTRGIDVDDIRNFIARNIARTNGTNYTIVAGNRLAQIVVPAVNAADVSTNFGSSDGFTNVDPWANFSY